MQRDLGWDKAYCTAVPHPRQLGAALACAQLAVLRLQKRDMPWRIFGAATSRLLRTTAQMVEWQTLDPAAARAAEPRPPATAPAVPGRTAAAPRPGQLTTALTVAGLSWYVAVNKTTPSDLTAIYNCSAFFAYVPSARPAAQRASAAGQERRRGRRHRRRAGGRVRRRGK